MYFLTVILKQQLLVLVKVALITFKEI